MRDQIERPRSCDWSLRCAIVFWCTSISTETTDTDESEFRPALAARDGVEHSHGEIPDGFYLVDDSENPQPEFQKAVIAEVARVTHIAPPDRNGQIIGSPVVASGVINYPFKKLGLCAGMTRARYT